MGTKGNIKQSADGPSRLPVRTHDVVLDLGDSLQSTPPPIIRDGTEKITKAMRTYEEMMYQMIGSGSLTFGLIDKPGQDGTKVIIRPAFPDKDAICIYIVRDLEAHAALCEVTRELA
jgi:hypothetical protein